MQYVFAVYYYYLFQWSVSILPACELSLSLLLLLIITISQRWGGYGVYPRITVYKVKSHPGWDLSPSRDIFHTNTHTCRQFLPTSMLLDRWRKLGNSEETHADIVVNPELRIELGVMWQRCHRINDWFKSMTVVNIQDIACLIYDIKGKMNGSCSFYVAVQRAELLQCTLNMMRCGWGRSHLGRDHAPRYRNVSWFAMTLLSK